MKKLMVIFAGIMIFLSASSFTEKDPANENENVTKVFNADFAGATEVTWKEKGSFYFANFTLNDKIMAAAYDENGKLVATSRLIPREEVPAKLLKRAEGNFRNGHSGPYVAELTYEGQTSYFFDIVTDRFVISCNADPDGVITEDSRMKLQK